MRISKHKRLFGGLFAVLTAASLVGCHADSADSGSKAEKPAEKQPTLFDTYVSNTVISTGCNTIIKNAESVTYRAWFPVEAAGSFDYRFYFSNTVDSTWGDGSDSYVGMPGGSYTIESAKVYDGGTEFDANVTPSVSVPVTFSNGSTTKEVQPDETFWSDTVNITDNIPSHNLYLIFFLIRFPSPLFSAT